MAATAEEHPLAIDRLEPLLAPSSVQQRCDPAMAIGLTRTHQLSIAGSSTISSGFA